MYGGDVIEFEIASGQTRWITNKGIRVERIYYVEGYAFSRDGRQVAFDRETRDAGSNLWVRDLDGSNLRALYSESGRSSPSTGRPTDRLHPLRFRKVSGDANSQLVADLDQPTAPCAS